MSALNSEVNKRLLAVLHADTSIPPGDLSNLENTAERSGRRLDDVIQRLGLLSDSALRQVLARAADCPLFDPRMAIELEPAAFEPSDVAFFRTAKCCPVLDTDEGLTVALLDPFDHNLIATLAYHSNRNIIPIVASPLHISELLARLFVSDTQVDGDGPEQDLTALAEDGAVVAFVQSILSGAIAQHASDIHLESGEHALRVRYRIDGALRDIAREATLSSSAVISRIKVLAALNISERRLPQDGRFRQRLQGRQIDFRVSTLPTRHGESTVLRVLDQANAPGGLADLGMPADVITGIEAIIARPSGLFLATGPTGSGKTTTLYAALQQLNQTRSKVFSVEDPIEYAIDGVNQVQINSATGLSFATALRAILRQDPNVIMIGEIRDVETAEIACRAALMGRFVLSTLHTNSATEAQTRLLDLGVERYLIDAVLCGVVGQRLDPVACSSCKRSGCEDCGQTGWGARQLRCELITHS